MDAAGLERVNDCSASDLNVIYTSDSRPCESTHIHNGRSTEESEGTQYFVASSNVGSSGESLSGVRNRMTSAQSDLHVSKSVALSEHTTSCAPSEAPAPCGDMDLPVNKTSTCVAAHALLGEQNRSESTVLGSRKLGERHGAMMVEPSPVESRNESETARFEPQFSTMHAEHIHTDMGTSPNVAYVNHTLPQTDDAHLTPEERTKQRRMLRNRESAARSREKRKQRNMELESSIANLKASSDNMQHLHAELTKLVGTMKAVVKKHKLI